MQAVLQRVKVNLEQHRQIIHQSRNKCRDNNVPVLHADKFRHQKRGRAHNRRHDRAARRSGRFNRAGEFRIVADTLHQRDCKRTRADHVGNGGTRNRAKQRRGHNGNLGRTTAEAAEQRVGQLAHIRADARNREERAKDDKGRNKGCGRIKRRTENSLRGKADQVDKAIYLHAAMLQQRREQLAEKGIEYKEGNHRGHERADVRPAVID